MLRVYYRLEGEGIILSTLKCYPIESRKGYEMKTTFMLFSAALILTVFSCGSSSTGPNPPPQDDWLPLDVGNLWNYSIDGFMIPGSSPDTIDIGGSIVRSVSALLDHSGGFKVYEFRSVMSMSFTTPDTSWVNQDTMYIYLRNTDDEIQAYDDTVSTDYMIVAPLPLTLNETWNPVPDSTPVREVISLDASLTVTAGTFTDCAVIRETDPSEPDEQWDEYICRGIGIISDRTTHGDDLEMIMNLESYSVQ